MRSTAMILLLILAALADADKLMSPQVRDSLDEVTRKLVESLLNRAPKVLSVYHTALDRTSVGKTATISRPLHPGRILPTSRLPIHIPLKHPRSGLKMRAYEPSEEAESKEAAAPQGGQELSSDSSMGKTELRSMLRGAPRPVPGFPCIPVSLTGLLAPGQRATMHIYDDSSLKVLKQVKEHFNNTYGQVVIDDDALKERKFKLLALGSRVKVLSLTPSTHRAVDKWGFEGGSSPSVMAEVIGIGMIEPEEVLQKMPFMTVQCSPDSLPLPPAEVLPTADTAQWEQSLSEKASLCQGLEEVASFKGPLTQATERRIGELSLADSAELVAQMRGDEMCESSRLTVSALAATAYLPGKDRLEAMELAQNGQTSRLIKFVRDALDEEGRRRLAVKALQFLPTADSSE
eukprot:gnl/TRDRNA2_/TRDRNA2_80325_c0_seq1.p1 gnl/TRDRNA2_/TRDRNA2_80325_c0~~gnl/TRDRNA2_/TRDRNA2_80325_c0_seq1.p1  ORF type:complete len:404 (+),score=61.40 gnl/TRDRNA2_/TRDRNA2_80325_c0_seq1:125-1336(+)